MPADAAQAAQSLLAGARYGVLSTLRRSHQPGWPMGSLAPFALTPRGAPLFAFSALAEHTKNVLADPRASLFVLAAAAATGGPAGCWRWPRRASSAAFGAAAWIPGADLSR